MESRNQSFKNSLRCLQHPATLLSIALLLLNDHVFKIISPSWLTGKLSDFAGLFFFPFIVAAGLSILLSKFNLKVHHVGQLSFMLVSIWFFLLKTFPPVNYLTSEFSSLLIGSSTYFILDWTDIAGLIMLVPAWKIWQKSPQIELLKRSYISLAAGLFACLATSPALPPFDTILALGSQDGILYAEGADSYYLVHSTNNGNNWKWIYPREGEREKLESLLHGHTLPMSVCDPILQQNCYRIAGDEKVLISNDGGASWEIGWEVPPERRDFVLRISGSITTHDLLIVEKNDSRFLFVAMGNNGILRKQLPDGEWDRIGIEEAQPAPFFAPDPATAITIVRNEMAIWVGVAFIAFLIVTIAIWKRFSSEKSLISLADRLSGNIFGTMAFILAETVIAVAGFLLLIVLDFMLLFLTQKFMDILSDLAIMVAIIAPFSWLIWRTDRWIIKMSPDDTARIKIILYCVLTVLGIMIIGGLPWLLWALGTIPNYQSAQISSIGVSILIIATSCYLISTAK